MTVWTDPGQCSSCKFCSMEPSDMDPFCVHPIVLKVYNIGLNINTAINDYCGENLELREPRNGSL